MKQLVDEAELASETLDRAEAAERELADLRAWLDDRQARPSSAPGCDAGSTRAGFVCGMSDTPAHPPHLAAMWCSRAGLLSENRTLP